MLRRVAHWPANFILNYTRSGGSGQHAIPSLYISAVQQTALLFALVNMEQI